MTLRDPTRLYDGEPGPAAACIARAVSVATHPPVLSAFTFTLLNASPWDPATFALSTVVTMLTATVIPIAVVQHYSVKFGNTDGDVARREDRAKPLLGGMLSYIAGVILLLAVGAPGLSTAMMVSYALSTAAVALISTRWKISIHATGVTGPAISLSMAYPPWGYAVFLLIPAVCWSRYVRRKHTPAQLIGGTVFGLVFTYAVLAMLSS